MDLLQTTPTDRQADNNVANEDVLVVLPTENGEQIALPMSALPRDFVPGDSGQFIVVESSIDEQHQEVIVDSSGALSVAQTVEIGQDYGNSIDLQQARDVSMEVEVSVSSPNKSEKSRQKQKRKEPIILRPLSKEDEKMELRIIEELSPSIQEVTIKRKPRKEYRTKKRIRLAAMQEEERQKYNAGLDTTSSVEDSIDMDNQATTHPHKPSSRHSQNNKSRPQRQAGHPTIGMKQEQVKQEVPKSPMEPQKPTQQQTLRQLAPTERRTRLSNACRVATGKSYKCNDCEFSTDRINNIIIHIKESCPKLKKIL